MHQGLENKIRAESLCFLETAYTRATKKVIHCLPMCKGWQESSATFQKG